MEGGIDWPYSIRRSGEPHLAARDTSQIPTVLPNVSKRCWGRDNAVPSTAAGHATPCFIIIFTFPGIEPRIPCSIIPEPSFMTRDIVYNISDLDD